jgi:hypothetical protein
MPLKNSWIFPVVQAIHLTGIAFLVGVIVITDLRDLGSGVHRRVGEFARWTRVGGVIMFITGPILFASDIARYASNPAFRFKMVFLLAAGVFHCRCRDRLPPKLAAVISILLWTCVVIGGRAIADFDI